MVYVLRHHLAFLRTVSYHRVLFPRTQIYSSNTGSFRTYVRGKFAYFHNYRSLDRQDGVMAREDWLVIGLAGATCSGKSTIAKEIHSLFANSVLIHQDDYFHEPNSEKHTRIPELNHINFEILFSIDMESMKNRINAVLQEGMSVEDLEARRLDLEKRMRQKVTSSEIVPVNECLLRKISSLKRIPNLLILDGFLVLNDDELYELCDLRFYFTIEKAICWERRKNRTYDPADVPGYFEWYVWPYYLIHYEEVLKKGPDIKFIDGADSRENNFRSLLHKLLTYLS